MQRNFYWSLVTIRLFSVRIRDGHMKDAMDVIMGLCSSGYSPNDIIQTLFKVTRAFPMPEPEKLEFLREVGFTHMRMVDGLNTQLQLVGCISRLHNIKKRLVAASS